MNGSDIRRRAFVTAAFVTAAVLSSRQVMALVRLRVVNHAAGSAAGIGR